MKQKFIKFTMVVLAAWGVNSASAQIPAPGCAAVPPACVTDQAAYDTTIANDTFCCATAWDTICQGAYDGLSASCAGGGCAVIPPACATDAAAVATVQANDPFCCDTAWDALCQAAYDALSGSCGACVIGAGCAVLPPACVTDCAAWTTVVTNDTFCCATAWDALCQGAYDALNASCAGSCVAVPPPCVDTASACYTTTVTNDTFCCATAWDAICQAAYDGCSNSCVCSTIGLNCGVVPPACVIDCISWQAVVDNDSFCCDTSWDALCQGAYDALNGSCSGNCTVVTIDMFDSFGDGWNGAVFNLTDLATNTVVWTGTLAGGSIGSASFCANDGCYSFEVTPDPFGNELSWNLNGFDQGPLSGGGSFLQIVSINTSPCSLPCPTPLAVLCGDSQAGTMDESTSLVTGPGCSGIPLVTGGDWYVFNGTGDELTVSTCGSTNDTKIHVFELVGPCGDQASYQCVAGNDDFCGLQSQLQFNTTAGTDYYIVVSAFSAGSVGAYTVNFTCAPPCLPVPSNDDCASAQFMLSCISFPGTLDCAQATTVGNPCGSPFQTWYDVWYSFSSEGPSGTWSSIDFTVPNIDAAANLGFTVWSTPDLGGGSYDCNALTAVACCGPYAPGQVCTGSFFGIGLTVDPNTVYLFQIWSQDNQGAFEFEACGEYIGCTDPLADNYNPDATQNDGSCIYGANCVNNGGTVVTVNLFDSFGDGWNNAFYTWTDIATATVIGDGTLINGTQDSHQWCLLPGCYDFSVTGGGFPTEVSWAITGADYPFGGGAPSSQIIPVGGADCGPVGCTDPAAINYDPLAIIDDGSCACVPIPCGVVPPPCVDINSCCYNDVVTADSFCCNTAWDGICQSAYDQCDTSCLPACGIPIACNYDPAAFNFDNNLCEFTSCAGCTYVDADNYNANATLDDGSCTYPPCIDTCPADLNNDGQVGFADLTIFLGAYGTVCP